MQVVTADKGAALSAKKLGFSRLILKKDCPDFITLLMCFISFGSISGAMNVSDGTIFDVYLFSDCLNENLLFFAKRFQSIPNMLERSCILVKQILNVWKKFI